jgi:hypothetical protein
LGWNRLAHFLDPGASTIRLTDDGHPFNVRAQLGPNNTGTTVVSLGVDGYNAVTADFGAAGSEGYSTLGRPTLRLPTFIEPVKADPNSVAMDEAVSRAEQAGQLDQMISLLKPILPGLKDLRILKTGTRYALYIGEESGPAWPAIMAGDGFKKLLLVAGDIAADQSGLVLIEEPETHLHVGALGLLSKLLWQAVKAAEPKQIFITTHSLELIDALFGAERAELDRAVVYRLSLARDAGEEGALSRPAARGGSAAPHLGVREERGRDPE